MPDLNPAPEDTLLINPWSKAPVIEPAATAEQFKREVKVDRYALDPRPESMP
jgi:hypothetical protein